MLIAVWKTLNLFGGIMMKKLLIVLFAMLLVLTTACSDKKSSTDEKDNNKKEGPVTLKVVYKDEGPSNPVAKQYFESLSKALKEDENLDVTFELVEMPQGNYAEKLNLLLLSGDIPDMIYFQGGDLQISQQGLLEDLTPYIEKSKN